MTSRPASPGSDARPPKCSTSWSARSTWLRNKAFRRVWHATSIYKTEAMELTPRKMLEAHAHAGNWAAFPVSPRPYFARLGSLYRGGYFDYRGVALVVLQLEIEGDRMMMAAISDDERLAIRRAVLAACIEAMAHVDDSGGDLGDHFREREQQYLDAVRPYVGRPGVLRNLLELVVWEDYGLFDHVHGFLGQMTEPVGDLAIREPTQIISKLRETELEYQLEKARRFLGHVLETAGSRGVSTSEGLDAE